MMRVAAIDCGTNSTRLLAAEALAGGFRTIDRRLVITRLGQGVDRTRVLDVDALQRTLSTIADYAALCGELGIERMRVTGTSAVRDALNRAEFFDGVRKLTGCEAEVLSGDEEGRLTFLGVTSDLAGGGDVLVVDIGGGSTELILGDSAPRAVISLDVGCVRMHEKFIYSDPPAPEELEALREEVRGYLQGALDVLQPPHGARLIGVAGTVAQLAILKAGIPVYDPDVTHHAVLSHGDVRSIARRLTSLDIARRKRLKGMEAGRADVIVAGAEILLCVMEALDAPEVMMSERDILDGLVIELLQTSDARGEAG